MTDLKTLFPHPLPCIAIEQWTSVTGWPEYRIVHMTDEGSETLCLADDHPAAVTAAKGIAEKRALPFTDLSRDDY